MKKHHENSELHPDDQVNKDCEHCHLNRREIWEEFQMFVRLFNGNQPLISS